MHQPISSFFVGQQPRPPLGVGHEVELVQLLDRPVAGLALDARRARARWCWNFTCSGSRWIWTHSIGSLPLPVLLQVRMPSSSSYSAGTARGSPCRARPTARRPCASGRCRSGSTGSRSGRAPAWCLWLNGIGWSGPGASGSQAAAWERQAIRVGKGLSNSARDLDLERRVRGLAGLQLLRLADAVCAQRARRRAARAADAPPDQQRCSAGAAATRTSTWGRVAGGHHRERTRPSTDRCATPLAGALRPPGRATEARRRCEGCTDGCERPVH